MSEIQGSVSDVNEVLAKATGVKLRRSGAEGSKTRISVRGLEGKRIGFFIDETAMNENSDFVDINDIPVEFIERIEIYKGVVPAKFGGAAVGGAVNIVIKDFPPKYLDLSYSLKSFNTHKVSVISKINNKKRGIELGLGGFYTFSENDYRMKAPYKKGLRVKRDHNRYEKQVFGTPIKLTKLWFDEIEIEPVFMHTEKQIQGTRRNIQKAETSNDSYILSVSLEKNDFFTKGLDFDFSLGFVYGENKFIDTATYCMGWDGKVDPYAPIGVGEIGEHKNNSKNKKHNLLSKLNLNYLLNSTNAINFNLYANLVKGNPKDALKDAKVGYQTNFKSTMNSMVLGISHELQSKNQKFLSALTAKYYYYNIDTKFVEGYKNKNSPQIVNLIKNDYGISYALRYRFSPKFLTKVSASYDVRLPSEEELIGDGFLVIPSPNLIPERNRSVNIGFMYDKSYGKNNRIQLESNIFYNKLTDMIRHQPGGNLQSQYKNFGEMRTLGIDAEIKWDCTNFLYTYANATYQDLRDTREFAEEDETPNPTKNDRMPNIPYFYANFGFEMHKANLLGGTSQNSRLLVDASFVEEYPYTFERDAVDAEFIPQAFTIDTGIEHSFNNQSIILGVQVNNITDAEVISEFKHPLPGRNWAVKLRYIFK